MCQALRQKIRHLFEHKDKQSEPRGLEDHRLRLLSTCYSNLIKLIARISCHWAMKSRPRGLISGLSIPRTPKSMAPFKAQPPNNGSEMCTDLRANCIGKCCEKTARMRNTFSHICFVISAFQRQAFVSANICHFNGKSVRIVDCGAVSVSPIGIP